MGDSHLSTAPTVLVHNPSAHYLREIYWMTLMDNKVFIACTV